jgi:hypothetical protein
MLSISEVIDLLNVHAVYFAGFATVDESIGNESNKENTNFTNTPR